MDVHRLLTLDFFHTISMIFTNTKRTTNTLHIREHIKTTAMINLPLPRKHRGTRFSATTWSFILLMNTTTFVTHPEAHDSTIRASSINSTQAFLEAASTAETTLADHPTTRKRSCRRVATITIQSTRWSKTLERKFTFGRATDTIRSTRTKSQKNETCQRRSQRRTTSDHAQKAWTSQCPGGFSTIASPPTRFTIKSWKKVKTSSGISEGGNCATNEHKVVNKFGFVYDELKENANRDVPPNLKTNRWRKVLHKSCLWRRVYRTLEPAHSVHIYSRSANYDVVGNKLKITF